MLSHPGRVRQGNEDACAASLSAGIFVVCDGMGGAAGGEVASHLATETLVSYLLPPDPQAAKPAKQSTPQSRLTAAIQAANHLVYQKSRHTPELSGMGTTLVALLHAPPEKPVEEANATSGSIMIRPAAPSLWLAHVGDSRCYLYRNRELSQLTDDHSLVEEQVRAGQITADEAARSPMRNFITRAVGSAPTVDIDIQSIRPQPGDLYLLASDGLNRELSDSDIAMLLADIPSPATQPYLAATCKTLVAAANQNGGRDNVTVLLLAFPHGIERRKPKQS
jgi:serine/threonine protein phosphatase PrpC